MGSNASNHAAALNDSVQPTEAEQEAAVSVIKEYLDRTQDRLIVTTRGKQDEYRTSLFIPSVYQVGEMLINCTKH